MKKALLLAILALLISGPGCSSTSDKPGENVLYQDDFSNETTGWPRARTDEGITDYENGIYRIFVNLENQDYPRTPGLNLQSDLRVEVDATKVAGSDDNDFGVMCRYQDNNNFYQFFVSSDGYVGILKMVDGASQNISADQLIDHPAVNIGNAMNRIGADCLGDTLTMYVNGQQVLTARDTTFMTGGDVGIFAGTYDEPGTDIHFDNFIVIKP